MSDVESGANRATVTAAIRGDADAVRAIWRANRRWVAALLLAHKPREAELEDLLQDVAMTVVSRIRDLRDDDALRPWLKTVALNTARAAGRKAARRRENPTFHLVGTDLPAEPEPQHAASHRTEEAERVMQLARELPDGYRDPLIMRCVRGMSYRQISAVLGLPESTIETRIARGRRMLRELALTDAEPAHQAAKTTRKGAAR